MMLSIFILLLQVFSLNTSAQENPLGRFFNQVKTISLPEFPLIGEVTMLDVNERGRLLITDRISGEVFLYDDDGSHITTLSPEECSPGAFWQPSKALFHTNGDIFIINSGPPWGIHFSPDGICLGILGLHFLGPLHIAFDNNGNIFGFYIANDGNYIKKMNPEGEEEKRFGIFPDAFTNLISHFEGGGLLVSGETIYHMNIHSPDVHLYSLDGNHIKTIKNRPSYFRGVDKDLPAFGGDPGRFLNEVGNILKNRTIVYSLHSLDEAKLLVQYKHHNTYGIEVLHPDTGVVYAEPILTDRPFFAARNGLLYMVNAHKPDNKGILQNPVIDVYGFEKVRTVLEK